VAREPDPRLWLGLGALGLLVALAGAAEVGELGFRAWLAAAMLVMSVPAGATGLSFVARLVPGPWRDLDEPLRELARLLPIGAFMMVPVLLAAPELYPWSGEPQATLFRALWLSTPFFVIRTLVWLALFGALALAVILTRSRKVAAPALIVFVLPRASASTSSPSRC
jgi:hypothetical protein